MKTAGEKISMITAYDFSFAKLFKNRNIKQTEALKPMNSPYRGYTSKIIQTFKEQH
jgi:ketopantoate hydroxymethyltransferase